MSKKKLIRFDWAMKTILRDKANFDVLEGFLGALLDDDNVKILNILESESNQKTEDDKFNRVDLLILDKEKRKIYIEIQNTRHNTKKYDAIFIDVFNSQFSLPFQLTTLEFVQHQYKALNAGGLVIVNIISSIRHKSNEFLLSEAKTFQQVFPKVEFFAVADPKNDTLIQNIMLIAFKDYQPTQQAFINDSLFAAFLANKIDLNISNEISILTDDYAPVEYFVSKMINHYYGVD